MSSFSNLEKKYNDFRVPAYKIMCGGAELKYSEFTVTEISVDNCVGETAGAARFTLINVYEPGSRQFNSNAGSKMKPGTKVSISLGYGSETTEVFTGYIDELKVRFDEEQISMTAICLDARGLMRIGAAYAAAKDKKIQDIVTAIFDKYSALVTSKSITLSAWEQEVNLTQIGGDLDFVCSAAESRGALFYIDCGKAVVGDAENTDCVEFDWGQFQLDLSVYYLDEKEIAYGYDAQQMKPSTYEADAKQTANQEDLITVESVFRLPLYFNEDAGKAHVTALSKARIREAVHGTIYCVGLPEAKIGQKIKINKFPLASFGVSNKLTVCSVGHKYDYERGFSTEIGVMGG